MDTTTTTSTPHAGSTIDYVACAGGISAVADYGNDKRYRGDVRWHPICDSSASLLGMTGEQEIRISVGDHTVHAYVTPTCTVVAVCPTGHPIVKSIRRMIRRAYRIKTAAPEATATT